MKRKFALRFSTTHLILLSFLLLILIGSLLLALPISSATGKSLPYIDALFTATTATCVTGLVTVTTASAWSPFGQAVILCLIQIGGLGLITVFSGFWLFLNQRIGIGGHLLLQDAFNLNTMSGLSSFLRKVLIGTLTVEGIGALLYMPVFIPEFGINGIWISIFNSVSAFCNAGMDIIGNNSLCDYATHPLVNFVTCTLIVLGGIGYIVWWDFLRVLKRFRRQRFKCFRSLTLHSKIAIFSSLLLIFGGALLILIFERQNPATLAGMPFFDQVQIALFQSVTTRTAGFATLPQENLTNASSFICLLLMFIGGSPVGTAGGIKTVTFSLLIASTVSSVIGRVEVTLFRRSVTRQAVGKAIAVACMSLFIAFSSTILLSAISDAPALDIIFETVSATATVGLSRNLTASLPLWGKLLLICTMYLGRVGPISLAFAFNVKKESPNLITHPAEDVSVG